MKKVLVMIGILPWVMAGFINTDEGYLDFKSTLSEYKLFTGDLRNLEPAANVIPFEVNMPLFSDYAQKARFFKLPESGKITYSNEGVLGFPRGTILVKNFYFPEDFSMPDGKRKILETRLLINSEDGWVAAPYIWNNEQSEAHLEVAGGTVEVKWKPQKGKRQFNNYSIPNVNQCKGCHIKNGQLLPLGPTASQLNRLGSGKLNGRNQLDFFSEKGWIKNIDIAAIPATSNWDRKTDNLEKMARDYLDVNCAHCHNPEAPANTSGLFLNQSNTDPVSLGVMKTPVAAGRGSGGLSYDIVPGNPEKSILIYRMKSKDPGIMMPEIGRTLVHEEGVRLISKWIREMNNE